MLMKKIFVYWICIVFLAVTGGGGCNVFNDISNKNSDAAKIDDVINLIDKGLWNDAVLKLQTLSPSGQAQRSVQVLFATAYAGRGGLDVLNLANSLSSASSSTSIFTTLMKSFKGATIGNFNDQTVAEGYIQGISLNASGRTSDENLLMIFIEFAKLGTLFAARADTNADGVLDATYNSCTAHNAFESAHIVTALGILVDALAETGSAIANQSTSTLTSFCSLYNGACNTLQVGSTTLLQQQTGRTLAGETHLAVGLGVAAQKDICEFTAPQGNCQLSGTPLCP